MRWRFRGIPELCAVAAFFPCVHAQAGGTFASRTVLEPGQTTYIGSIVGEIPSVADTVLGLLDESGNLIGVNDDVSEYYGESDALKVRNSPFPLLSGRASGLFGYSVNADQTIRLRVSGYPDGSGDDTGPLFDGFESDPVDMTTHGESGSIGVALELFDAGGSPAESIFQESAGSLTGDNVLDFIFSDPDWPAGFTFDVIVGNAAGISPDGLFDFVTFAGLDPFTLYSAEVTAAPFDTTLTLWDAGKAIADDDDGGVGTLSRIEGLSNASGEFTVALGMYDMEETGGAFTIELNAVAIPESAMAPWLLALPLLVLIVRRRRGA